MEEELEEQKEDIWIEIFSSSPSFNNINITNYFNNEPRFNGAFSRNNLRRTKDGVHVINLNDKNSKGTHWISLFFDRNLAVYFDSLSIKYVPQKILNKIRDKINYSQYI